MAVTPIRTEFCGNTRRLAVMTQALLRLFEDRRPFIWLAYEWRVPCLFASCRLLQSSKGKQAWYDRFRRALFLGIAAVTFFEQYGPDSAGPRHSKADKMILPSEDADLEIAKVEAIDIAEAGATSFAYLHLTDEHFELLNADLFKRSASQGCKRAWDDATLMIRGADAGRDVILTRKGSIVGVVQCKRTESPVSLPGVFREIAKLVLFGAANQDLSFESEVDYFLSLARDPSGTVVDFFVRRVEFEAKRIDDIRSAAREVRESYVTLAKLTEDEAERLVLDALPKLRLHLLRPADLDEWMQREASVMSRFFRHRLVVDNDALLAVEERMMEQLTKMSAKLPITDKDLSILRARIEATPETHRLNFLFAMIFGLPREMFTESNDLERRARKLAHLLNEILSDYTDWVFARTRAMADEICQSREVAYGLPLFARGFPVQFLTLVAKGCLNKAISGGTMATIVAKGLKRSDPDDDEGRIEQVKAEMLAEGIRYLNRDFTHFLGNQEDLLFKRRIVDAMMVGLKSAADVEKTLDEAIVVLRPKLFTAATALREKCSHPVSIILTGNSGLDSPEGVRRFAETVGALKALRSEGLGE